MYGLMKAPICSRHAEATQPRRLHYCGTCKTMGSLYGQRTRFLLNNDAVFLAELLTALSPQRQPLSEWAAAYRSYNCLTLPGDTAEMPLPLQIAATSTLLMAEFKVADQIEDGGNAGWKAANKLLSPAFLAAARRMEEWGFPVEEFRRWAGVQRCRETAANENRENRENRQNRECPDNAGSAAILASLAEPTATVTALVFEHSGAMVGCDAPTQRKLYDLGFAFGSLIYVLDAYEDFGRDARRGDFNALAAAFNAREADLPESGEDAAVERLHALRDSAIEALQALPLSHDSRSLFSSRLRLNLARRLGEPTNAGSCATPAQPVEDEKNGVGARWRSASSLARTLALRHIEENAGARTARLAKPYVFGSVLILAMLFPRQARAAGSYRECRDIAFNLIFLGEALRDLFAVPARLRLVPALAGSGPPYHAMSNEEGGQPLVSSSGGGIPRSKAARRARPARGGCCSGCCNDFVCCCDDSCCSCDGCCCACESAECLSGCCDCASGGC